jgi:hypothetical protein
MLLLLRTLARLGNNVVYVWATELQRTTGHGRATADGIRRTPTGCGSTRKGNVIRPSLHRIIIVTITAALVNLCYFRFCWTARLSAGRITWRHDDTLPDRE